MRFPVRPLRGSLPARVEHAARRFVWDDPRVVLDPDVTPEAFRTAMDAIEVGGTVKITKADRHPDADALLLDNVDTTGLTIVDLGASDGSTSVDLIRRLPAFASFVIADLFLTLDVVSARGRDLFFDHDGTCVLVAGRRLLAWPTRSRLVRLLTAPLVRRIMRRGTPPRQVSLLNPATRAVIAADPRVRTAVHDIFRPWPAPAPDVIKVANVLGPYFDDDTIVRALQALHDGLAEGGHLLLVDNGRITGAEPRAGLYRRTSDGFERVAQTRTVPQLDALVPRVSGRRAG